MTYLKNIYMKEIRTIILNNNGKFARRNKKSYP